MGNYKLGKSEYRHRWHKKHKAQNPEKHKDWKLRALYNITLGEVLAQREKQLNKCAICGFTKELVVDHDHKEGRFRALLCRACNLMIGYAQEKPRILERGISYLNAFNADFTGVGTMGFDSENRDIS